MKLIRNVLNFSDCHSKEDELVKINNFLKRRPDEEWWDIFQYPFMRGKKKGKTFVSPNYFISNKGNVYSSITGDLFEVHPNAVTGYVSVLVGSNTVYVHRAVACAFIPRGVYKDTPYSNLTANHLSGVKFENDFANLEWTTNQGNILHAVDTGLIKANSYVATVMVESEWKGYKFFVKTINELQSLGFFKNAVHRNIYGYMDSAYGCSWEYADVNSESNQLPSPSQELLDLLQHTRAIGLTKAVLGTVIVEGPYKGHQFVLLGEREIFSNGFDRSQVSKVCKGKRNKHLGCKWEYITLDDSRNYSVGISDELKFYLKNQRHGRSANV